MTVNVVSLTIFYFKIYLFKSKYFTNTVRKENIKNCQKESDIVLRVEMNT